jgi:hypothetical protein
LGVGALIAQACALHEKKLLGQTLTPLFADACPWERVTDVPEKVSRHGLPALSTITAAVADYRAGLTATAGHLGAWLDASEEDIRSLAMQFAKLDLSDIPDLSVMSVRDALLALPAVTGFPGMVCLLSRAVLPQSSIAKKVLWAESLLSGPVPGSTLEAQFARMSDARFWRRGIRVILLREREHFFMRMHLIHKLREAYVSDTQLSNRLAQLKRQREWMRETVLLPRYLAPGEDVEDLLTLEQVATSPRTRFAKLYTFVKAMDVLAVDAGLSAAMVTLTLEPEWHPNPSNGNCSWNGATPREAHQSIAARWQSVLRDLDRFGVGVSGLRVVEPHKDGCPHWHVWLLYKPEAMQTIMETVMRYFPNKLKVRTAQSDCKGSSKVHCKNVMYDTLENLKIGNGRSAVMSIRSNDKERSEGSQVEFACIDRDISSGASYAMKYLLKTVDGGGALNSNGDLFNTADMCPKALEKRAKHAAAAKRVDAYRSLWGINAGQLFGVAKCLSGWDELRRLNTEPEHPFLRSLWVLARGTDKEGRIGGGEQIRGDAQGFIQALGGLAACGKTTQGAPAFSIGRLTEEAQNGYNETIVRTKGVTLVKRSKALVAVGERIKKGTGEVIVKKALRSVKTVLASVTTRFGEWTLASNQKTAQEKRMGVKVTKKLKSAIALAEKRFMVQLNEGGRAPRKAGGAGVLVGLVGRGIAVSNAEPPLESSPWALATA